MTNTAYREDARHFTETVKEGNVTLETEWYQEVSGESTFCRCRALDARGVILKDSIGNIMALCRTRQQAVDSVKRRLKAEGRANA